MEILAHTLWTTALARKAKKEAKKKNKELKLSIAWAGFFGIFPDLFAFTIPFVISFYKIATGQWTLSSFATKHQIVGGFDLAHTLYTYSHSLVLWAVVFLIVWALLKRPPWVLLAWAFHILLDIPSHAIGFFPTPFLFPISKYVFPYGVAWSTPWFMIVNYIFLAFVWGGILFKKYRGKKLSDKI